MLCRGEANSIPRGAIMDSSYDLSSPALKELSCIFSPPSGMLPVIYFVGTIITPANMHVAWKTKMGNWRDVCKAVLSDRENFMKKVTNFTYKNVIDIPEKTMRPIQRASNEDYMNEDVMRRKSMAAAGMVRFLKKVIETREDISEDPRLRRYIMLDHALKEIKRRKSKVDDALTSKKRMDKKNCTKETQTTKLRNDREYVKIEERPRSALVLSSQLAQRWKASDKSKGKRHTIKVKGTTKWSRMLRGLPANKHTGYFY